MLYLLTSSFHCFELSVGSHKLLKKGAVYLKERNFRVDLFSRVIFLNISRGFNFANLLPVDLSRGFLYILIFSWFVLQLVVCEVRNSHSNFSIFQIALCGYKRLNSRLNAQEEIKRSRYNKKIYSFLFMLSFPFLCFLFTLWFDIL